MGSVSSIQGIEPLENKLLEMELADVCSKSWVFNMSLKDHEFGLELMARGWKIHGLWPNYNNGTWDEFCDLSAEFDLSLIANLIVDLESEWSGFDNMTDQSLWSHEWLKHGTCSFPYITDQVDYFTKGLSLQRKYNLDVSNVVHLTKVQAALTKGSYC